MVLSLRDDMGDSKGTQSGEVIDFLNQLRRYETINQRVLTTLEIQELEWEHKEFVMNYFLYHQQSTTIAEYESSFLELKRWAETWSEENFDEQWVVDRFVAGLKEEIRSNVERSYPRSLNQAINSAKWQGMYPAHKAFEKIIKPELGHKRQPTDKGIDDNQHTGDPIVLQIQTPLRSSAHEARGRELFGLVQNTQEADFVIKNVHGFNCNFVPINQNLRIDGVAFAGELSGGDQLYKFVEQDDYNIELKPKPPDGNLSREVIRETRAKFVNEKEAPNTKTTEREPNMKVNFVLSLPLISSDHVYIFASSISSAFGCFGYWLMVFDEITKRNEYSWKFELKRDGLYWGERGKSEITEFLFSHFQKLFLLNYDGHHSKIISQAEKTQLQTQVECENLVVMSNIKEILRHNYQLDQYAPIYVPKASIIDNSKVKLDGDCEIGKLEKAEFRSHFMKPYLLNNGNCAALLYSQKKKKILLKLGSTNGAFQVTYAWALRISMNTYGLILLSSIHAPFHSTFSFSRNIFELCILKLVSKCSSSEGKSWDALKHTLGCICVQAFGPLPQIEAMIVGEGYTGHKVGGATEINNLEVTILYPDPWCMLCLFTMDIISFCKRYYTNKEVHVIKGTIAVGVPSGANNGEVKEVYFGDDNVPIAAMKDCDWFGGKGPPKEQIFEGYSNGYRSLLATVHALDIDWDQRKEAIVCPSHMMIHTDFSETEEILVMQIHDDSHKLLLKFFVYKMKWQQLLFGVQSFLKVHSTISLGKLATYKEVNLEGKVISNISHF